MDTQSQTEQNPAIINSHVDDGFFVLQNEYYRKILYADILWLEASGSYCYLNIADGKRIIVAHTLSEVGQKLPSERFIRIHRSTIVNLYAVDCFTGNMLYINRNRLHISSPYRKLVFACFNVLERKRDSMRT